MTRTKKKSNLTAARARMYHDLVFECAERVFAEQGFDESTMQDVAAEAGISLKTLYATFSGKDDIYSAIVAERSAGLLEATVGADPERDAREILAEGIQGIVAYFLEHPCFFRILERDGHGWGMNPRAAAGQRGYTEGLKSVIGVLQQGIADGVFLAADPLLLAPTVMAVLQVQIAALLDRKTTADPADAAALVLVPLFRLLCGNDGPKQAATAAA